MASFTGDSYCTVRRVGGGTVLIIAPDERWLRVLEATLKLGGYQPIARRSVDEAMRMRASDERPIAVVVDLGVDSGAIEVETIRTLLEHELLADQRGKIVVILPERLAELREALDIGGVHVLVRPYPPSELYAAIGAGRAPNEDEEGE